MSEKSFWNEDWLKLQQQYWNQWGNLQRQAMGLDKPPLNPWEQGLHHWWSAVKDAVPPTGQDFYQKMMEQGRGFFQTAEQIMKASSPQENPTEIWSRLMTNLANNFCQSTGLGDAKQCTGFWEMPLDNWNRMVSVLSPVPGDILRGMPSSGLKENLNRMLDAPGLGYTRESQAQYQSLAQAVMEYQEAMAEYTLFFNRMGEKSVNRLQERVTGTPIESARQLYDSWIGCCEEVYAEQVMTPEYISLHGRLVNALMLVKSRSGEILSELYAMYNVPTRDDLRTLQIRMQEQRRENKSLRAEVAKLQRAVTELSTAPAPAPASAPTPTAAAPKPAPRTRTVSAKKKVSTKKSVADNSQP